MTLSLASLFTTDVLAHAFDTQCEAQAAQGRTFAPLLFALDNAYSLQVPAGTINAIKYLNLNLFTLETMPKLAKGAGAKAAVVTVTQALHSYAVALHAGMAEEKQAAIVVAAMPAWADPVAIAAKKVAKKDAKAEAAKDAEAGAVLTTAPEETEAYAPRDLHAEAMAAWAKFAPYIMAGVITAEERDGFTAQLALTVTAAESEASESVQGAGFDGAKSRKPRAVPAPTSTVAEAASAVQ